ncbi:MULTISPECIES: ROK family protein [Rhodomicrobium]|uniref:glucokinase n=1 Tax=Rhodomicrobium TaxID=1068 RepID=UPI000B4C1BCD|nr:MULTISPECIES: ROK family protein [Rhodomicrobium]
MRPWRLVADVGGSNVRFARSRAQHALSERRSYPLTDFDSFPDALAAFLDETGGAEGCSAAVVGVAGPVDGDKVKLTNAPWSLEAGEIAAMLAGAPARLINDLQAVALSLPYLEADELIPIGEAERKSAPRQTMLAVNVGTGFGGATVIPAGAGWVTNPGEPGHMRLGGCTALELELVQDAGCVEEVLSGRGVEPLYRRLAARAGVTGEPGVSGAKIFASASEHAVATETVRQFSALLGRVAGDLVLASAAWGGVYLCGSVVNGWAAAGGGALFRAPFEDKGPMRSRMETVYSGIIARDDAALIGLTYLPIEAGEAVL